MVKLSVMGRKSIVFLPQFVLILLLGCKSMLIFSLLSHTEGSSTATPKRAVLWKHLRVVALQRTPVVPPHGKEISNLIPEVNGMQMLLGFISRT